MKKFICTICGYVHEGEEAPEKCPVCKAPKDKFKELAGEITWADEHRIGVAKDAEPEIVSAIGAEYAAACREAAVYMAMARQAEREGFFEIAEAYRLYSAAKVEHAARLSELSGEGVSDNTKQNLEESIQTEVAGCDSKKKLAVKAKQLNLDAVHDTVHEMCKDQARFGSALNGLKSRYFQ